jgi:hypothetical protein
MLSFASSVVPVVVEVKKMSMAWQIASPRAKHFDVKLDLSTSTDDVAGTA